MSTTGEQPAQPLSKSSPVALGLALLACAGVATGAMGVGDARSRLSAVEDNAKVDRARVERVENSVSAQAVRDAEVKKDLEYLKSGMDALQRDVARALERRGVRNAGGER